MACDRANARGWSIGGQNSYLRTDVIYGGRSITVREFVGADNSAAADLHFPGQPVKTLPSLPAAVDLRRDLLILRDERLVRRAWSAMAGLVQVEGVPHDPPPDAERLRDQEDARHRRPITAAGCDRKMSCGEFSQAQKFLMACTII